MKSEPWQRKVFERHLDLMLAEELTCNRAFNRWFLEQAILLGDLPDEEPIDVIVEVSHGDNIAHESDADGENDLFVRARYANEQEVRVLIEDKLDAVLQPDQAGRYERRAAAHSEHAGVIAVGAAVVGPAAYLDRHASELTGLRPISIEAISQELDAIARHLDTTGGEPELAARLRWRADRLVRLDQGRRTATPDHPPTMAVRDYIVAELAATEPHAIPSVLTMRTVNTGWLYFKEPSALLYKVTHGQVDIYLKTIWPDDEERQRAIHSQDAGPSGFVSTRDSVGNLVFRCQLRSEREPTWRITELARVDELDRGVQACTDATRWIISQQELTSSTWWQR